MAVKHDDRTARGWPLPAHGNRLYDDVDRLIETLNIIDRSFSSVDTHESGIEGRQDFLDTRMDVIAGQATEDTEILDARIDATREVHPNLGHNIRNIHATLVGLIDDFQGLLHQFNLLTQAQIQGELNEVEAHKRRKKEIELEALTRLIQDDGLQHQINEASKAILQTALNLHDINDRRKADSMYEDNIRSFDDGILQEQIDKLAEGLTNEVLNLHDVVKRRKKALAQEIQERINHDELLQAQIDTTSQASLENAYNLHQEAETRRKELSEANQRIDALVSENENRKSEIQSETEASESRDKELHDALNSEKNIREHEAVEFDKALNVEAQARVEGELGLARQANATANAILQTELSLLEANERRKTDLICEEQERIKHDVDLQTQIDSALTAGIENTLAIAQEAEERRKVAGEAQENFEYLCREDARLESKLESETLGRKTEDEALQADINSEKITRAEQFSELDKKLNIEVQARFENDSGVARQANANAEAIIQTVLSLLETDEKRKAELASEQQARIENDTDLQKQINKASTASLENTQAIHEEAEQRRGLGHRIEALEDSSVLSDDLDEYHQNQLDSFAVADMQDALNLHDEAEQRRKDIAEEAQARFAEDVKQQKQTDTASGAILENVLNIANEAQKRRELAGRLIEEVHKREREIQNLLIKIGELYEIPLPGIDEKFATLQKQALRNAEANLENSANIRAEAEQRRRLAENLNDKIVRNERNDKHNQKQIDSLVKAILKDALNLRDEILRRRAAIDQEVHTHISSVSDLQTQVDKTSTAGLENSLAIAQEAEQRRYSDEQIKILKDETVQQREIDGYHQKQIDDLTQAVLENSIALSEALERRKAELLQETQKRLTNDTCLQRQVDKFSVAGIENAIAISHEAEQRRTFGDRIETLESKSELGSEQDTYQQTQLDFLVNAVLQSAVNLRKEIECRRNTAETERLELINRTSDIQAQADKTAESIIENSLTVQNSNEIRRAEDSQERFTRFDEDGHIQEQVNALAKTCLLLSIENRDTRQKLKEIEETVSKDGTNFDDSVFDEAMADLFPS